MLVTLESLINDNISNNTKIIDMESLEFDIVDTMMECNDIERDITTLSSGITVMESVQMEGFGDKIKETFKIAIDKIIQFFKDIGRLIKKLALTIKYKFSNAKKKREILSKLNDEKQNLKITMTSWNPLINHFLLNKIDERVLNFSNTNQAFKRIQFVTQQSFDNMISKTSALFIDVHKGLDKDEAIQRMNEIIAEYPDIIVDVEKYKQDLYSVFGLDVHVKLGKTLQDSITDGDYKQNITITYKDLIDKIYYINRVFDSLSATCDDHVQVCVKDITTFTNKIEIIRKQLSEDIMPISDVSFMRLLDTLKKFAGIYQNLVLDINKFTDMCNTAENSFSETIKTVDEHIKNFDTMNGEYNRGDVYIQI